MTNEQLEKQISEEFEKWIKGMDFHCQWEVDNHLISLDAYFNYVADVAFKAAALPLMKKIKEIRRINQSEALLNTSLHRENEKLQKENEEIRKDLLWVIEKSTFGNKAPVTAKEFYEKCQELLEKHDLNKVDY